jgi:hypothetical protein
VVSWDLSEADSLDQRLAPIFFCQDDIAEMLRTNVRHRSRT